MDKLTHFFKRDGEHRDLTKPLLEFLKPIPAPPRTRNHFEQNQYQFFKDLGKDFATYPLIKPHEHPELTMEIASMNLEGKCHEVATSLFTPDESVTDLVFGFVDSYVDGKYDGTYSHSFLIEKNMNQIIDPLIIKYTHLGFGSRLYNCNYFGVIIPFDTLFNLSYLCLKENLKYDDLGVLPSYIFKNKTMTKKIITDIQAQHSSKQEQAPWQNYTVL